jgi:hypothetical protein
MLDSMLITQTEKSFIKNASSGPDWLQPLISKPKFFLRIAK